jgi:uncharacterized membrane protein YjjB (DUF3815 family)
LGGHGSPLLAAFLLGVASHLYARLTGQIPATFVIPGLLQLAPGFLGTEAVFALLSGHGSESTEPARLFDVFMTALQLVTGLLLADVLAGGEVRARFGPRTARPKPAPTH